MKIVTKRIYDPPTSDDGYRMLVDRLWPRGMTKEKADLSEWNKDLAPSTALRVWFHHNPDLWNQFLKKYKEELEQQDLGKNWLKAHRQQAVITLLYATKDKIHSHATILQQYLQELSKKTKP